MSRYLPIGRVRLNRTNQPTNQRTAGAVHAHRITHARIARIAPQLDVSSISSAGYVDVVVSMLSALLTLVLSLTMLLLAVTKPKVRESSTNLIKSPSSWVWRSNTYATCDGIHSFLTRLDSFLYPNPLSLTPLYDHRSPPLQHRRRRRRHRADPKAKVPRPRRADPNAKPAPLWLAGALLLLVASSLVVMVGAEINPARTAQPQDPAVTPAGPKIVKGGALLFVDDIE